MKRILALLVLTIGLLLPLAAAAASVPEAADAMASAMDVQMARKLGQEAPPAKGISIMVTTPVDLGDLEGANGLARQMAEEMSRWFVQAGYRVQEIRKGRTILFQPETGELLLTRKTELLGTQNVSSVAILAGTYTITPKAVRFNMRLIHTPHGHGAGFRGTAPAAGARHAHRTHPAQRGHQPALTPRFRRPAPRARGARARAPRPGYGPPRPAVQDGAAPFWVGRFFVRLRRAGGNAPCTPLNGADAYEHESALTTSPLPYGFQFFTPFLMKTSPRRVSATGVHRTNQKVWEDGGPGEGTFSKRFLPPVILASNLFHVPASARWARAESRRSPRLRAGCGRAADLRRRGRRRWLRPRLPGPGAALRPRGPRR